MGDFTGRGGSISRRGLMLGAAGAAAATTLPAPAVLAQSTAPIKLGFLNSLTGSQSYGGLSALDGMQVYFDRINWTTGGGRKIELLREDDQFNPQVGLEKAKKFVEQDKVAMLVGPQGSNVAMAMLNYVQQVKAFLVVEGAGTDAITRKLHPYIFRTSISAWQLSMPMAEYIADKLTKEVVLTGADYAGGHDVMNEFKVVFAAKGGKILKEMYPPLGTTDFSAYFTDLKSIAPKATYNFYPGSDALRFMQQYTQYGLSKIAALTGFELIDQVVLPAVGDAALGVVTAVPYVDTLDTPENKSFVAEYQKKTGGKLPDHFADYGFTAAMAIDKTLQATGGDTDRDKLAAAMVNVAFTGARGPFRFDPKTHNPIQNIYVCEVQKVGGQLKNMPIQTYHDVQDPGDTQSAG
jgi:branched-chain amino acid transport system substrate-binding protein